MLAHLKGVSVTSHELAPFIDHTLLKPETSRVQVEKLCQEAIEYGFYAVCVNPRFVGVCKQLLQNSPVKIACVVGFPLGANSTRTKVSEAKEAVSSGADEIDMVISLGAVKDDNWIDVQNEIKEIVQAVPHTVVKVIIETSLLTHDEKIKACQASLAAGAHFVKTSTGFNGGGATVEDVLLMKKIVGPHVQVKASGGIRDLESAQKMIAAGATRLGTSSGVLLVTGHATKGDY
jgi:deoxyribose-phosphate aldolase